MKVGDLVTIRHISGIGMVTGTLSGDSCYFDVYMIASCKILFCHARELSVVNESR